MKQDIRAHLSFSVAVHGVLLLMMLIHVASDVTSIPPVEVEMIEQKQEPPGELADKYQDGASGEPARQVDEWGRLKNGTLGEQVATDVYLERLRKRVEQAWLPQVKAEVKRYLAAGIVIKCNTLVLLVINKEGYVSKKEVIESPCHKASLDQIALASIPVFAGPPPVHPLEVSWRFYISP